MYSVLSTMLVLDLLLCVVLLFVWEEIFFCAFVDGRGTAQPQPTSPPPRLHTTPPHSLSRSRSRQQQSVCQAAKHQQAAASHSARSIRWRACSRYRYGHMSWDLGWGLFERPTRRTTHRTGLEHAHIREPLLSCCRPIFLNSKHEEGGRAGLLLPVRSLTLPLLLLRLFFFFFLRSSV